MSDYFKTLREPLIEQQKKTDAKQDVVIEQLRENQLALTGGLRDLVESNRDVLRLQKELPFPSGVEERSWKKPKETIIAEPNNLFTENELKFLKESNLIEPNRLLNQEKGKLDFLSKNVTEKRNAISRKIGNFKRKSTPTESDFMENEKNLKTRDVLN